MAEGNRVSGVVRWFSGQKGFGFIAPDGAGEGEDVFVHQTSIRSDGFRTLGEGEIVEFVIDVSEDGRSKAVDVVSLNRPSGGRGRGRSGRGGRMGRGGDGEGYEGGFGYGRGGRGGGRRGGRVDGDAIGGGGGACYNCGRTGHLARDCYQNSGEDGGELHGGGGSGRGEYGGGRGRGGYGGRRGRGVNNGGGAGEYTGGGGRGGGRSGGKCYNCGEEGHFARECPSHQI